jgi:hypothetical protein
LPKNIGNVPWPGSIGSSMCSNYVMSFSTLLCMESVVYTRSFTFSSFPRL